MFWTINLMYLILFTTVTGAVFTVVWYVIGKILEWVGFINISYLLMKLVMLFWVMPLMYVAWCYFGVRDTIWNGMIFEATPSILKFSYVFCIVWALGFIFLTGMYIGQIRITRMMVAGSIDCNLHTREILRQECCRRGIKQKVEIRQSYKLRNNICVLGVFKPLILMPVDGFDDEKLRIFIRHELTHILHGDILFLNVAIWVRNIHFMNPFVWMFYYLIRKWNEYECDYSLCNTDVNIHNYYEAIISIITESEEIEGVTSQLIMNENRLRERIRHVMKSYGKKKKSSMLAALLVAAMTVLSTTSVVASTYGLAGLTAGMAVQTEAEDEDAGVQEDTENQEHIEPVREDGYTDEVGEVIVTYDTYPAYSFKWTIKPAFRKTAPTFGFPVNARQIITVSVHAVPEDAQFRVGIVQPDATRRYVDGTGTIVHAFDIYMTGRYQVYVQNLGVTSIEASGAVAVLD